MSEENKIMFWKRSKEELDLTNSRSKDRGDKEDEKPLKEGIGNE